VMADRRRPHPGIDANEQDRNGRADYVSQTTMHSWQSNGAHPRRSRLQTVR
jgi:hypothetical protein